MILFTCDIDWAPEEVIDDTLSLFNEYGVKCTVFATGKSSVLKNCDRFLFEIGIHPNFNSLLEGDLSRNATMIISDLKELYPEAKGIRSHSLVNGSYFFNKFVQLGFAYEANTILPYMEINPPWKDWYGLWHISFNWEDDVHFAYNKEYEDLEIPISSNNLTIFNFHPVHIYLNTENEKRYLSAKQFYKEPKKLIELRNKSEINGARDALLSLLQTVKNNKMETKTLSELLVDGNKR